MLIRKRCIAVTLLLVMQFSANSELVRQTALLEVGSFHGDEVPLNEPKDWLGVFCKQLVCDARHTTIKTARVHDEVVDEDTKANTGTSVSVSSQEQPLFLVRGIAPTSRSIPTVFQGEKNMVAGDLLPIGFSGANYELRVDGKKMEDEPLPKGSRLIFSNGSTMQEVFSLPEGGNDPYITVLWVGDIDGDGKPDLLVITSWHYNVSHKVLWLSSLAKPGQLVGLAAIFETTGC